MSVEDPDSISAEPIEAEANPETPAEPETSVPAQAALVPRRDRYPRNLFLVSAPGAVLFPDLTVPLALHEPWAERAVIQARSQSEWIGMVIQSTPLAGEGPPDPEGIPRIGCLARIVREIQLPDGNRTYLFQGVRRFHVDRFLRKAPYLIAKVSYPDEQPAADDESEAMARNVRILLKELIEATPHATEEMGIAALNIERAGPLADFASAYFVKEVEVRTKLLAELRVKTRLRMVNELLLKERHILDLGHKIQEEIREKIEERQREFFLREQLRSIRRELGEEKDEQALEVESFEKQLEEKEVPDHVRDRAREELRRLRVIPQESPESGLLRGYLEWLLGLPWGLETTDTQDLAHARDVLEGDHSGLEEIKERIVEFLAVRQRVPGHKGQILCFAGPPGVGKTSLGRSIADALGRKFIRISLGGVHDEAEIRGHRRTYIGSLPGRIVRGLKTAGTMNPVFVLDELDKVGQDFRGDPSSALLEVLDPEQNSTFSDHYLEVPVDLSRVFFIATANEIGAVPPALRDRLEVIEMSGYVTEEKLDIARHFLIPKQLENHGLKRSELSIRPAVVRTIVEQYTREAGVRGLEKSLARLCRKAVTVLASEKESRVSVTTRNLTEYLGVPRFPKERRRKALSPGVATGLAWTPVGGEVLEVQVRELPKAARSLEVTGMLGDVMLESARIAVSLVTGQAKSLEVSSPNLKEQGLHIHVPAGAVKKDGPSAGITMATALVSYLRQTPVRATLAMTGEVTLTGQVLAVGGIRDKILAARRYGITEVVLPAPNRQDVEEIRPELVKGMKFHFVEEFDEVVGLAFRGQKRARAGGIRG